MRKVLYISYVCLLILGLFLFLPIREALFLTYSQFCNFGGYLAVCYTLLGTLIVFLLEFKDSKEERGWFTFIAFVLLLTVNLSLFCGAQWIFDHFS